jgi:hypothetical protein
MASVLDGLSPHVTCVIDKESLCYKNCTYHNDPDGVCEQYLAYKCGDKNAAETNATLSRELINFVSLLGPSNATTHRPTTCPVSGINCMGGCTSLANRFPNCHLANTVDFVGPMAADEFFALADTEYADLKEGYERSCYIGFPDIEKLDHAAGVLYEAFKETSYLVGSATTTKKYRDVDVRMIMPDDKYEKLFGTSSISPFWSVLCTSISYWMRHVTGLPVDFQIQKRSRANHYQGKRHPLGMAHRVHLSTEQKPVWLVNDDDSD